MQLLSDALARFSTWKPQKQIVWLMLGAFVVLVLATPLNLVHGFLDAEEGTTYFRYARLVTPLQAFLAPHQQYFGLFPNVMALVEARVLPLAWAAVTAAWAVLLVHLFTAYMAVQCEPLARGRTKLLAVAILLLAPGAAAVRVGSTQTQFVFALQCLLVLISDPDRHRISRTVCTVMGGLDGVVSCLLTPFFLHRAWRTGSGMAWLQAGILCACTAVQSVVLLHALPYATRGKIPHRSISTFILSLSNHMLVLPFLTRFVYHPASRLGRAPLFVSLLCSLVSLIGFALLAKIVWPSGSLARLLLLIGFFHASCGFFGIEGPARDVLGGGERYFYVANAAIALALILRCADAFSLAGRGNPALWLVALVLVSGAIDVVRFWKLNQSGTVWADEVRAWRRDPIHVTLTANPAGWNNNRMYLTPKPTNMDAPFYLFDSNTRPDVLDRLPRRLFGPDPGGLDAPKAPTAYP